MNWPALEQTLAKRSSRRQSSRYLRTSRILTYCTTSLGLEIAVSKDEALFHDALKELL